MADENNLFKDLYYVPPSVWKQLPQPPFWARPELAG